MTVIGKASIDIRANDKFFERDVKRMAKGIKDVVVNVKANVQIPAVTKQLNEWRKRQESRVLQIKADINTDVIQRRIDGIWEENDGRTVSMNLDFDHTSAWRSLARFRDSVAGASGVALRLNIDEEELHDQIEMFEDHYKNNPIELSAALSTEEAVARLQTLQAYGESDPIDIDTDLNAIATEAQLRTLTRDRHARVIVSLDRNRLKDLENLLASSTTKAFRLFGGGGNNPIANMFRDPQIQKAIEGMSYATLGLVPPKAVKDTITGLAENFEQIAIKSAQIATAVGSISAALTTAVGFASRLLVDLGQIIGLAAILPAGIAAAVATMKSLNIAWEGFSDALVADPIEAGKAISKLYKPAQSTAWALQRIVQATDEAVKKNYWKTLGNSVRDTAKIIKDDIAGGMGAVSIATAQNTIAVSESVAAFGKAGGIKVVFDNITEALQNATGGTRNFSDAILTLTEEGSKRLPVLGEWFTTIGEQFNDFIQESADSGAILQWIDQGTQRLQELGVVALSTGRMIGSIANAAEDAGIGGLTEMAEGFERVADALSSFEGQSVMRDLFRDSSVSMQFMVDGLGALLRGVQTTVPQIGDIFTTTGDIVGTVLEYIGEMFSDTGMMDGAVALVNGTKEALDQMGPTFDNLGEIFGHLGEMFGTLMEVMAPGFNTITGWLETFLANFKSGWQSATETLNDVVHIFSAFLNGPISTAGAVLGGLLDIIGSIPAPMLAMATAALTLHSGVKTLLASFAVGGLGDRMRSSLVLPFMMMQDKASSSFASIRSGASGVAKGVGGSFRNLGVAGLNAFSMLNRGALNLVPKYGPELAAQVPMVQRSVGTIRSTVGGLKGIASGIGGAFRGIGGAIVSALGGPVILAITAVVTAVAGLVINAQENQRKYEASVQGYADAWDPVQQSFSGTMEDIKRQTDRMSDMKVGTLFSDFSSELEKAGTTAETFAENLSDLNMQELSSLADEIDGVKTAFENMSLTGTSFDEIKHMISNETLDTIGITRDTLNDMGNIQFRALIGGLDEITTEADEGANSAKTLKRELENLAGVVPDNLFTIAENGSQGLRDALVSANDHAGTLKQNFDTIASVTSTVEQKTSAMKSNLELMALDTSSWNDPLRQMATTTEETNTAFTELKESAAGLDLSGLMSIETTFSGARHAILDFNGELGGVAGQIQDIMSNSADSIHSVAAATYDQVFKTTGDTATAVAAAVSSTQPHIEGLVASMQDLGIPNDEIHALLDTFGLLPEEIATSLNVEGVDTAIQQMLQVELAAQAISSGDWTAYIQVMDSEAQATLDRFTQGADNQEDIQMKLGLNDDEFQSLMVEIATAEYPAQVLADLDTVSMEQKLAGFVDHTQRIEAQVDTIGVDEAIAQLDGFPEFIKTYIETEGNLGAYESEVNRLLAWVEGLDPEITTKPEYAGFMAEIEALKGEVEGNPATQKVIGDATPAKEEAQRVSSEIEGNTPTLKVDGEASAARQEADRAALEISNKDARFTIDGEKGANTDSVISGIVGQTESGATFPINLDLGQLEHMRGVLRHYQNTTLDISTNVNMGGVEHLRGVLKHYQNTTVTVTAVANLGGVHALQGAMGAISDKVVTVIANVMPAMGSLAMVSGLTISDKVFTVIANIASAVMAILALNNLSVSDKSFSIRADASQANALMRNIRAQRIPNKTYTITAIQQSTNANGGYYSTFANGGMDPRIAKALSRVKNKKENHVAQIANGSNNFRIWGEAETGGEAYIPLSRAKRARSMAILEQVASHFGVALSQYADGGYNMGGKSLGGGVTSFADGGTTASERRRKAKEHRERVQNLKVDFTDSARNALISFSDSIASQFGKPSSPVNESISGLRESLFDAIKSLENTNKGLANRARSFRSSIARQDSFSGIWKSGNVVDSGLNFLDRNVTSAGNLTKAGKAARITLKDLEYAQTKLNSRLEDARDLLSDINSQYDSARSSIRGGLEGELDFSSLLGDTDEFGYRAPVTARSISEYAKNYNRKLKGFGQKLSKLRGAGYNAFLVDEIANMGLEDGTYLADALLSDKSFLKDINNSFSYSRGRWGKDEEGMFGLVGGMADTIGKASSNAMFGASKQATEGLIKGMENNLSDIEALGRRMANSLTAGFKKALGIRSPSRVFMKQADFIAQGLIEGFDRNQSLLDNRVGSLVKPRKLTTDFGSVNSNLHNNGTMNSQTNADRTPISVIVNPSAGMDEELIGNSAARELQWRMDER